MNEGGAGREWVPKPGLKPLLAGASRSTAMRERELNTAIESGRNVRHVAPAVGY